MDPIEISALGGAGSALVAALSYFAKTRHERRRSTRAVLYYLLELHHVVHRVRAGVKAAESELPRHLKAACEARGIQFVEADAGKAIADAKPLLFSFGRQELERVVAGSSESYERALADLAKENPVLAFRLRGRDQMTLVQQRLESFAEENGDNSAVNNDAATGIELPPISDAFFLSMALAELRAAIQSTAWGCDVWTHVSTLWMLKFRYGDELSGDLKDMIKHMAESLIADLVAKAGSSGAPGSPTAAT